MIRMDKSSGQNRVKVYGYSSLDPCFSVILVRETMSIFIGEKLFLRRVNSLVLIPSESNSDNFFLTNFISAYLLSEEKRADSFL